MVLRISVPAFWMKKWNEWNGGDGGECVVHPLQQKYMMGSFQYGTRKITLDGGLSSDFSFNPEEGDYNIADWTAPLIVDHEDQMNVFHYGTKVHSNSKFGEMGAWKEIGNPNVGVINNAAMSSSNFSLMAISSRENYVEWRQRQNLEINNTRTAKFNYFCNYF